MGSLSFVESMELVAAFFEIIAAVILVVGLVVSVGLGDSDADSITRRSGGLSSSATVVRGRNHPWARGTGRGRPDPDRRHCPDHRECRHARVDRADSHGPELCLEIEIEGVVPWRRASLSGASHIAHAAKRSGVQLGDR